MRQLKTLGRLGWLVATRFWLVLGGAAVLFVLAVFGLWALGRNDLLVAMAHALTTDTAIWMTKGFYPVTLASLIFYGFWADKLFPRFLRDESGQDLVEYAFVAGFVATAAIAILPNVAPAIGLILCKWITPPSAETIRVIGSVAAVVLLVLIVLRRHRTLSRDERGQNLIEYALIAGFVATAAGFLMSSVSTSIRHVFAALQRILGGADPAPAVVIAAGNPGDDIAIRVICAAAAVVLLILIILRRRRPVE